MFIFEIFFVYLHFLLGKRLWTQWAPHEVFAITCQGDLNKDGVPDCVAGGRAGVSHY